jgi:hypothetical protein
MNTTTEIIFSTFYQTLMELNNNVKKSLNKQAWLNKKK